MEGSFMTSGWLLTALHLLVHLFDRLLWTIRDHYWRGRFGAVGRNFIFDPVTSKFVTPHLLKTGDDVFLNAYAHVSGDVTVGDRVLVGPGVKLLSGNHLFGIVGCHPRYLKASVDNPELLKKQVIEADAWIGAGAIVLGGVRIGAGSVVGAGAVVTRDVPPYVIAAGSPARPVRRIFDEAGLVQHLERIGTDAVTVRDVLERRAAAKVKELPVAVPLQPDRYLYRGVWMAAEKNKG
jgi:acetyltransferase-like isoleucine patch superfamily enzyme